ncbi:MAG: PilZ domain-containing protein [Alphaproteobacteria bacterium]|nr:PilZ domain-containing protein [Alphaproteobacteria bacterium]
MPAPKKERRLHKRSKTPTINLTIDGMSYRTSNLSIGGSLVEGYEGLLSAGSLLTITALVDTDGTLSDVEIRCRVIRGEPEAKRMAVTFLELDATAYDILQNAMAKRIEGLTLSEPKKD